MARPSAIRRFIHLLLADSKDGHTLHNIDTRPLFAAGASPEGPPPPPTAMTPHPLPRPAARFDCAHGRQFLPLGRGVERIVGVDRNRRTVIFDTRTATVRAGPDVRHLKWHGSVWAEAGGRLYHLGRGPGYDDQPCLDFEALSYDGRRGDWLWSLLPSPPFEDYSLTPTIASFADAGAGGQIIRVSKECDGTYAFDTASGAWRREGDWMMPFCGHAQYVADYGMWFGFSDEGKYDLSAADARLERRRHVWADVDGLANHAGNPAWLDSDRLSYLGCGRFCVTRFIEYDKNHRLFKMAVLTAVEATRDAGAGEIKMVRRASRCYHFPVHHSCCWAY